MAAVPPVKQPPPPNRYVRTWAPRATGSGPGVGIMPDSLPWSALATAPYEGDLSSTPLRIAHLGSDSQNRTVNIPALTVGQQYVAMVTIPHPNLPGYTAQQVGPVGASGPGPTPKLPITTRIQDQLVYRASMTVQNLLPGLHILRFTAQPQARSGPQVFNADQASGTLPPGQPYSSFMVACAVTFAAEQAVAAGVVTIASEGTLTRQAGGGAT